MKIERLDLYDFKLVLEQEEFAEVKAISDSNGDTIEETLLNIVNTGLFMETEKLE